MTVEEMKDRIRMLGYSIRQLSILTGVPVSTIRKILGGITVSPRTETLQKLEAVLQEEKDPEQAFRYDSQIPDQTVSEPSVPYGKKAQGEYTLEDYYALPDERRVELIDGVLYDMASPSGVHQELIGLLHLQFAGFVREQQGACKVFLSPFDVQLDRDERTMVQPDLLVICDRSKIMMRCCYGAPDMAVEIVSPSSRRKDLILKTQKYMNAGVREYWIIDPDRRQVLVYDFENGSYPLIYGFSDRVPVRIWDCRLQIDFASISREIAYLYESVQNHAEFE